MLAGWRLQEASRRGRGSLQRTGEHVGTRRQSNEKNENNGADQPFWLAKEGCKKLGRGAKTGTRQRTCGGLLGRVHFRTLGSITPYARSAHRFAKTIEAPRSRKIPWSRG